MKEIIDTPKGSFVIRVYGASDEKGVLDLWRAAFGKEMGPGIWRWKYLNNPYGFQIMLCVNQDEIPVAMYAGIPFIANWQGKQIRITHLMDNMSHPGYRGVVGGRSGLFIRTANAFFDFYGGPNASAYMYGFPGKRHFLLGKRILRYNFVSEGVAFLTAQTSELKKKIRLFSGKIDLISGFDALGDNNFEGYSQYYPFAVLRNVSFLGWRFLQHPYNKYEIWGYRSYTEKTLMAYAVFSVQGETAYLVDILAPRSNKIIRNFLAKIGSEMACTGIEKIGTWLPANHFLTKAVILNGFRPASEPLGIIPTGRTFLPDLSFKWSSDHIFYTMADGDLF